MRIVIPGGSGQVGRVLARHFQAAGHQVTVLSRRARGGEPWAVLGWDGETAGAWVEALDGCDVCINLAGRSVDCRYTDANRREVYDSRVRSTRVLGEAIAALRRPPRVWLNASTATIYRHSLDRAMDEANGELGGGEAGAPASWDFSVGVAKAWEAAFFSAVTPGTRKVALRSAMTFSPAPGGVFAVLSRLVRMGLGGTVGSGRQFVSWVHEADFVRAVEWVIADEGFEGAVNVTAPCPLPNREFMAALRRAWGQPVGLPAAAWMVEVGSWAMRTESELVMKSRRVVPGRLLEAGFRFEFPEWEGAARELVRRWREMDRRRG